MIPLVTGPGIANREEQTAALPFSADVDHLLRSGEAPKKLASGLVHADIGRLRAQSDCHHQLIRVPELQLRLRRRIVLRKAAEELENLVPGHANRR